MSSEAHRAWYTNTFDLSGLREYKPQQHVKGTIRQWGNSDIRDGPLAGWWEKGFRKYHPHVKFSDNLTSSENAFPGLISGAADVGQIGRAALWEELQGFQREFAEAPLEITICTGSYQVPGRTFALGIFVNKENPLNRLTMDELDGIFGAQRSGGWKGLRWDASGARGPEKNIRTWGQLGLVGVWADKPIHVYGYAPQSHFSDEISKKVLHGSSKWNEAIKEYVDNVKTDGSLTSAGELFMADLAQDPYGIAYTGIAHRSAGTKALALGNGDGPFVELTLENVQNRTYPLIRDVYVYVRKPIDPKVKEFLRFVLSREGQELVMKDGKYLPLTAEAAREQLAKLE